MDSRKLERIVLIILALLNLFLLSVVLSDSLEARRNARETAAFRIAVQAVPEIARMTAFRIFEQDEFRFLPTAAFAQIADRMAVPVLELNVIGQPVGISVKQF